MALSAARDATIRARMAVSRPRRAFRTEGLTHLRRDCIGSHVYVRRSEAEQAKACADKAVLPAVVINQPIAMITTVVLDRQALKAIQEVWPGPRNGRHRHGLKPEPQAGGGPSAQGEFGAGSPWRIRPSAPRGQQHAEAERCPWLSDVRPHEGAGRRS